MTGTDTHIDHHAEIFLADDGIFRWNFAQKARVTVNIAEAEYLKVEKLLHGELVPVLVNMEGAIKIDRDSRTYYAENAPKYFTAGAIVVKSTFTRILAKFFMGLNKPPMPMKLVSSEEAGLAWLQQYKRS